MQTDPRTKVTELKNFNLCNLGYPVEKTKSPEKPTLVRIGFVAKCHYVSIKELPLETASKKVVEMKKKEILKTIPRETLEHFKETYGEKDLTLKKNGDLSWRSSRNKELLKEYLENIGPMERLKIWIRLQKNIWTLKPKIH